jgi:hypothetical protein
MDVFYATPTPVATAAPTKIRYSESYGSYNARRYSRPWIALVASWPVGGRPDLTWGSYLGDDDGGEVEIMAYPGSILRSGQKDGRGNGGSNNWWEAMPDGSMRMIDQSEARKIWTARSGK